MPRRVAPAAFTGSPSPWTPPSGPGPPRSARRSSRRPPTAPRPRRVRSRGTRSPAGRPAGGTGFGRIRGSSPQGPLAVGREGQAGAQVLSGQLGEVGQNLFRSHAPREVLQHVLHG